MKNNVVIVFANEIAVGQDGWAMLAPYGDHPGVSYTVGRGGKRTSRNALQRMDRTAAERMVANFQSLIGHAKRFAKGCPIYLGHPDVAEFANQHKDTMAKGMIVDLKADDDALWCKPVFTAEGGELVENKTVRAFSGTWTAELVGEINGVPVWRPAELKSVGLTNKPNLPVELFNEQLPDEQPPKPSIMEKAKLLAALKAAGIELPPEATDEQIEAAIASLKTKADGATEMANEKTTLSGQLTTAQAEVSTTKATLTAMTGRATTAETQFANERVAHTKTVLDQAQATGRITAAERATWEGKFQADFANAKQELAAKQPSLKTEAKTGNLGGRKPEAAAIAERREQIATFCNEQMTKTGCDYGTAFAACEKQKPELFAAMKQPASS